MQEAYVKNCDKPLRLLRITHECKMLYPPCSPNKNIITRLI